MLYQVRDYRPGTGAAGALMPAEPLWALRLRADFACQDEIRVTRYYGQEAQAFISENLFNRASQVAMTKFTGGSPLIRA